MPVGEGGHIGQGEEGLEQLGTAVVLRRQAVLLSVVGRRIEIQQ